MPYYEFRCPSCGVFVHSHPMSGVPDAQPCPTCAQPARHRPGGGALLHTGSPAARLLDATARTAHEPPVVAGPPAAQGARITRNPLHRKLPRP
ncbi:FmdB family zinc ribbon protein [Nocardia concava]|uniref:FmdB family zinc ribbon protein n=1 Tax=Nocardia concava TaxID=257281 RepID=UPI0002E55B45|nr:FmdB family zinc ribbon protein [Nocardia concava]